VDDIHINELIRLVPYTKTNEESVSWYQNPSMQLLINGSRTVYTRGEVDQMYRYQEAHGQLFYIYYDNSIAGDVFYSETDFSIVIAPNHQRKGIGRCTVQYFLDRLKVSGKKRMVIPEVYDYNACSNGLFQSLGFQKVVHEGYNSYYKKL